MQGYIIANKVTKNFQIAKLRMYVLNNIKKILNQKLVKTGQNRAGWTL